MTDMTILPPTLQPQYSSIPYDASCWFSVAPGGIRPCHGAQVWVELRDGSIVLCNVYHWRAGMEHCTSYLDVNLDFDHDLAPSVTRWTPVMKPNLSKDSIHAKQRTG